MKSNHYKICLWRLCVLLLSVLCGSASGDDTIYRVKFTCLPWKSMELPQGIFYETQGELIELKFNKVRRSSAYTFEGASPLVFFKQTAAANGEVMRVPVASADLATASLQSLLLFVIQPPVDPSQESSFRVITMDDSSDVFSAGFYKLINLSGESLYFQIGDEQRILKAMEQSLVNLTKQEKRLVDVSVLKKESGLTSQVYRSQWPSQPLQRSLVFFFPPTNAGSGGIETFVVTDYDLTGVESLGR